MNKLIMVGSIWNGNVKNAHIRIHDGNKWIQFGGFKNAEAYDERKRQERLIHSVVVIDKGGIE